MSDQLDTCGEGLSDDSTDATIGEASDGKGGNGVSVGPTIMNLNDMKAGMQGLDSDRINQMIFEWSNGSHFHSFQTKRQKRIDNEIQYMKTRLSRMTEWQRMQCLKEADSAVSRLEAQRSMTRVIVHIDLDMFFAAVETKLRPELVGKPMAVGGDMMLATSNYEARKYGIRPGMPGALAKRLCPQLIIISHSSGSYSKESAEVMKIIREFDPNLNSSMSLDEAYIDLTDYVVDTYCHRHPDFDRQSLNGCKQLPNCLWDLAAEIVSNLRQRILDETQLSASAGIACNTMIAKVCSDINKPNGQHMIRGNRLEIENFLENTAIRKICGIGPVRGQFLTALGLKTCKDLYFKRDIIRFAFTQYNAEYYLSVGLGVGRHVIAKDEDERTRKSSSSERTVSQISSFEAISELLAELSEELSEDLNSKNQSCKTVTIKLKKVTFVVTLRSLTLPFHTYDSETILNVAKSLLQTELNNTPPECRKYRLIGLKVSNLITNEPIRKSSQMTLSQIYRALKSNSNKETKEMNQICDETEKESKVEAEAKVAKEDNETKESLAINTTNDNKHEYVNQSLYESGLYECSVCFQTFALRNVFECHENECIEDMLKLSTEEHSISSDCEPTTTSHHISSPQTSAESNDHSSYLCPICGIQLTLKDNHELNAHIDVCLNKDKCLELTQVSSLPSTHNSTPNQKPTKRFNSDTKINGKKSQKCDSKRSRKQSLKSQQTIDTFFRFRSQ